MSCTLIVIAKEPRAGHSKTRLSPPLSPSEAAELAAAALHDTLAAVSATPVSRRVLALDGRAGEWLPPGFEVIPQRGAGLDQRLASAFEDAGGPAVLIGMDTPQVTPALLGRAIAQLALRDNDAVIGPAVDGGYWAIGVREPRRALFEGVPMSSTRTFSLQLARLLAAGLTVARLAPLRDVDLIEDAHVVAQLAPGTRFAGALGAALPAVA